MSDDVPSADECQARVEKFAQITQTDEALAQFYLQERDWNVEASIAAYFGDTGKLAVKRKEQETNHASPAKIQAVEQEIKKILPDKFSFITWNIDGLDDRNISRRTMAVVKIIQERKADIVFLQEVVPETYNMLQSNLSTEYILTKNKANDIFVDTASENKIYFTVTLLRRETLTRKSVFVKPYENSKMLRDLMVVEAKFENGAKLILINTHLESTKDFAGKHGSLHSTS